MWRGYMSHPVSSIVISLNNKQTKKGGCVWCDSVCVCVCVCAMGKKKKKKKRVWSDYIGRATNRRPFTGAIPLLRDTETFACCVSTLGRFVSPQTTWTPGAPPKGPYRCRAQRGHPIDMARLLTGAPPSNRSHSRPPSSWITGARHNSQPTEGAF